MSISIENAILSTFLDINDNNENLDDVYDLDTSIFTSSFRKRVAEKINSVNDNAYGFLSYEIENSIIGTNFESDFTDIQAQNSLGLKFSKKYHDRLVNESLLEVAL